MSESGMNREVLKLLKYSKADTMLSKKMSAFDLIDCFQDSRNFDSHFLFEHFLKASQALNNINNTMHSVYELYERLDNNGSLKDDEAAFLINKLKDLKKLYNKYYYLIRGLKIVEESEA